MSNEIKASVSDFKHKFCDECLDGRNGAAADSIDDEPLREFIEHVMRSQSSEKIEIPDWVVTDDDFVQWARSHE